MYVYGDMEDSLFAVVLPICHLTISCVWVQIPSASRTLEQDMHGCVIVVI